MIFSLAILLLGVESSWSSPSENGAIGTDIACCARSFKAFGYSPVDGSLRTVIYSNSTYDSLVTTTDASGNPVQTLVRNGSKYVRTVDGCTRFKAEFEIGQFCLRGGDKYLDEFVIDGAPYYHWIQTVGDLRNDVVVSRDCVPKISHMTYPNGESLYVEYFSIEVLPENTPKVSFDTSDCA